MADAPCVDRCICTGVTFADVLAAFPDADADPAAVMQATGAGLNCKHCRAFLREALKTRRTAIPLPPDRAAYTVLLQHFRLQQPVVEDQPTSTDTGDR